MADISKLILNGNTYNIKDAEARTNIENLSSTIAKGMRFIGEINGTLQKTLSTQASNAAGIADGASVNVYVRTGDTTATCYYSGTAPTDTELEGITITYQQLLSGDFVIYDDNDRTEYVWSTADNTWHMLGSASAGGGFGLLAYKDSVSASYTPTGTVSSSLTSETKTLTHTVTQGSVTASGNITPSGSITMTDSVSGSFVKSYPGVTSKLETTTIQGIGSDTTAITASKASVATANTMTATVDDTSETLTLTTSSISFNDVAINVPTTGSSITVATGKISETGSGDDVLIGLGDAVVSDAITSIGIPTFVGTEQVVTVTGNTTGVSVTDHEVIIPNDVSSTFTGEETTITSN